MDHFSLWILGSTNGRYVMRSTVPRKKVVDMTILSTETPHLCAKTPWRLRYAACRIAEQYR